VDPAIGQISRDGTCVRVETRTMGLLLCLAERAGKVVSIDELLDQVWTGVVVTPDSVYQAVASLRRLLGDDAKQPAYIETVPRLGYRLVATVSPWMDPPTSATDSAPVLPGEQPHEVSAEGQFRRKIPGLRGRAGALLASGALCLAIAAGFLMHGELNGLSAKAPQKSVAVLPFLDLTSEQMNEEVFADGMTEELIDKLSRIQGVRVPGPTSSFYFKGKQLPVANIAKSLGVTYVLDGSLRQSDATLRVAVRLIRADDGYIVWSETYDRPLADRLKLQDDIANQVANALRASIG
jgi:transcriptional activator of cad operon